MKLGKGEIARRIVAGVVAFLFGISFFWTAKQAYAAAQDPELPRVYVDSTTPDVSGYAVVNVPAGGNLQNLINGASCGTVITLQAGATYSGGFSIPNKGCTDKWIVLTTSQESQLPPPGQRINPSHAPYMAKLSTPSDSTATLTILPGASYYRFVGIEFTSTANWLNNIIYMQPGVSQTTSEFPHHITFDRVYIHGTPTSEYRRGIMLNGDYMAVVDSNISQIHQTGFDSQAIGVIASNGPIKIVNNYLEAASENLFFGGTYYFGSAVPSDLEVRGNHFYKPWSWYGKHSTYAGKEWFEKNLFETKSARRLLFEGNVMENAWGEAQAGWAFVLAPRTWDNGPKAVNEDFTIRNNIIRHTAGGATILGYDNLPIEEGGGPGALESNLARRIKFYNNIWEDISGPKYNADGYLLQLQLGPADISFDHNTAFTDGYGTLFTGAPYPPDWPNKSESFTWTNNLTTLAGYGVVGNGIGKNALDTQTTNYVFSNNVLQTPNDVSGSYPPGNHFPTSMSQVGFVNYAGGDYSLNAGSPYKNAGTDGKDIGADMAAVLHATRGAVTGVWNETVTVAPTFQSFPASGGTDLIRVTSPAGTSWKGTSNSSWITLTSGASGSGDGAVHYSVGPNPGSSTRSGSMTIAGHNVSITQEGAVPSCTYSVNPTQQNFSSSGGTGSVGVTANSGCAWTARSNASWISITAGASGSGSGTVVYSVSPNPAESPRSAAIFIGDHSVVISQAGACSFTVSPLSVSIPATGASGAVMITAPGGCSWTALSNASWIVVNSGSSGSGTGQVRYTIGTNSGAASRMGTVTAAGQTVTITQEKEMGACAYSILPIQQSIGAAGGTGSVTVTAPAGCAWKAQSYASWWLVVTAGSSGSGSGTVHYAVGPNPSYLTRTSILAIGDKVFTVTQEGFSCPYSISPSSQFVSAKGTVGIVKVNAPSGCKWTAASNADWISVGAGGSGAGRVYFSVGANNKPSVRIGTLTIAGKMFTVTQASGGAPAISPAK